MVNDGVVTNHYQCALYTLAYVSYNMVRAPFHESNIRLHKTKNYDYK